MTTPKLIEGHPSRGAAWEQGFSEPNFHFRRDFGTLLVAAQHENRLERHVFAILRQWATLPSDAVPADLSSIVRENDLTMTDFAMTDLAMTNPAMTKSSHDDIEQ
jgi:hypothetical protein